MGEFTRTTLQQYHIHWERAHLQLARSCMCYISICLKHPRKFGGSSGVGCSGFSSERTGRPHPISQPLRDYVLDDSLDHFRHLGSQFDLVLHDIEVLEKDIQQYSGMWDNICLSAARVMHSSTPSWPTSKHDLPLYILVAVAPHSLLSVFLRRTALKPKAGTNPLVYAAYFNKDDHARILLARDNKFNYAGWEPDRYLQVFPIEAALHCNHYDMVTLLVTERSAVPPHLFTRLLVDHNNFEGIPSSVKRMLLQTDDFVEAISDLGNEPVSQLLVSLESLMKRQDIDEGDLIDIVRRLIQVGSDPFGGSSYSNVPLHTAVEQGYISVARHLVSLGAPLPSDIHTMLRSQHFLKQSTAQMIRFLVENGVNALARTRFGDSLLHLAVEQFHEDDALETTKLLVRHGCDPFEVNRHGKTPLYISVKNWNVSVAQYLISLGAPLSPDLLLSTLNRGEQCYPVKDNRASMIRCLVENGVDALVHTSSGDSALHIVLMYCCEADALETSKFLVDHGCDPLETNSAGKTPLHLAIEQHHVSVVRYLLSLGAPLPPDVLLLPLSSPKQIWTIENKASMIRFLVESDANVHACSGFRDSTLHVALRQTHYEDDALKIAKTLVDHGCDPLAANSHGNTPLHIAIKRHHISAVRYLISFGIPLSPSPLLVVLKQLSAYMGREQEVSMIRLLVENGVEVSTSDFPLHIALRSFSDEDYALETTQLLVEHGYNPLEIDSNAQTAFDIAVKHGHVSAARYLLSLGVPLPSDILLNMSDWHNRVPKMIGLLVQNGANVLARNRTGDSVFHIALTLQSLNDEQALETAKYLVKHGCDPFEPNSDRKTPLLLAVERHYLSLARYLISLGASLGPDLLAILNIKNIYMTDKNASLIIHFLVDNGADLLAPMVSEDSVLHIALQAFREENNALEVAKLLVDYGCDPLKTNSDGKTPLHVAVEEGQVSAARYLLSLGVPLSPDMLFVVFQLKEQWRLWYRIPLMLRLLVDNGADVQGCTKDGNSVLHVALQELHGEDNALEATKLLVGSGCPPSQPNSHRKTPLHLAVEKGYASVVRYLLSLGAPLPPDILFAVSMRGMGEVASIIRLLVDNGVSAIARTGSGDSLLHIMLQEYQWSHEEEYALELAKLLVFHGCDPLEANSDGRTPLHIAVEQGHLSIVQYFLSLGVSPSPDLLLVVIQSNNWRTQHSKLPMLRLLVENGADVSAHTSQGVFLLHSALRMFNENEVLKTAKSLVGRGCDPLEANSDGETPIQIAVQQGHVSVAQYLLSLGASLPHDALFIALCTTDEGQNFPMMKFLVDKGASVLATISDGYSVLHVAIASINDENVLEAVIFLVARGCSPSMPNVYGKTPLHVAVARGHTKVVKYLLSLNIPLPSDILFTAIQSPTASLDLVKVLVTSGCDVQAHNSGRHTPLHVAIIEGHVDMVEYLLSVVGLKPSPNTLLSAIALAPPDVQGRMRRALNCLARSESPELPPAKRTRLQEP